MPSRRTAQTTIDALHSAAPKGRKKTGGRIAGTPNKATIEKREIRHYEEMRRNGVAVLKTGKEILEQFANYFASRAAFYQPREGNQNANEEKFLAMADRAVDAADRLAPYQSPRLKAIAVTQMPGAPIAPTEGSDVPGATSAMDPAEAFRLMKDGGTLTLIATKKVAGG